jgi:membrane protease YdiL (CAAX protease family)
MDTTTTQPQPVSRLRHLFTNPLENRLRGGWRLLIQALIYFGGSFIAQFILGMGAGIFLMANGMNVTDPKVVQSAMELPIFKLLAELIALVVILISCRFAAQRLDKRPFRAYGFHLNRKWWADLGFGLFLGAFLMLVIFLIERSAGWVRVTASPLSGAAWSAMLISLVVYLCVGFSEELLSRGYQIRNLAETLNARKHPRLAVLLACLGTSVFFGLLHAGNPNATPTSTLYLMFAGLQFGLAYLLTGELALPIGLHITWNFFQGNIFGFPVSGMGSGASILQIEQGGPVVWTGGAFGPEAGLIHLGAILLGVVLIAGWVRVTRGKVEIVSEMAEYRGETR